MFRVVSKLNCRIAWPLLALLLISFAVLSCGGGGQTVLPTITELSPDTIPAFSPAFTLTVRGTGYVSGTRVVFGNLFQATTVVHPGEVTAQVAESALTVPGVYQIRVVLPDGTASEPFDFTVSGSNPVPTISMLSPSTTTALSFGVIVIIDGTNFVNGSIAQWNDANRSTTFESSTRIRVVIPGTDLETAGESQITVFNPLPGGGRSNARAFSIVNPVPTITSLAPADKTVGDAAFELEVNGANFVQGAVVRFNGAPRATTFVNSSQLKAAIPASDLATASFAQISVFNPAPAGGASAPQSFLIRNPIPSVSTLNPASAVAGSSAFTLTVDGTNFVPAPSGGGSVVTFRGLVKPTTFVSSTRLTAQISSSDITNAGSAEVIVVNPEPGGASSAPVNFTVTPAPPGVVALLSIGYDGSEADGDSRNASLSADGRFVVFESDATNLVPGDTNGVTDIFLRDTCMGPSAPEDCVPVTTRVSVAPGGGQFFAPSRNPSISANARLIAFESDTDAALLTAPGTPTRILVHDTCNGDAVPAYCNPTTWRFALGDNFFSQSNIEEIRLAGLRRDGTQIALFTVQQELSMASYPVCAESADPSSCGSPASVNTVRKEPIVSSFFSISMAHGRFIAGTQHFERVPSVESDADDSLDVAFEYLCSKFEGFCRATSSAGSESVSAGFAIGFGDPLLNGVRQIILDKTLLISVRADHLIGNGDSFRPAISSDGRWSVFHSRATNLVPKDTNGRSDIFLARTGR